MKYLMTSLMVVSLTVAAAVSGCTASRLDARHPLISDASDGAAARIYFIRPRTERYLGVADNTFAVEVDRAHLLDLAKGEYALVYMTPGTVFITARSHTSWGPAHDIKEMTSTREFIFDAGQTYFVTFSAVDGEFRGVFFNPEGINLDQARQLASNLRPAGSSARNAPLDTL